MTAKPGAIEAARQWLPVAEAACAPATRDQRGVVLGRLLDHCAKPDAFTGDEKRIAAFWEAYHVDLDGIPVDILADAAGEWRRGDNRFFPRSGDLLAIIRKRGVMGRRALELRGLRRLADAEPVREVEPLNDEDADRMARLLKRLSGSLSDGSAV